MQTTAPDRSLQQRRTALAKANRIRTYRGNYKRGLRTLPKQVAVGAVRDAILDPPDELLSMPVVDFMRSIPNWGHHKVARVLIAAQVSPAKRIGGLSKRQRGALAAVLDAEANRR